MGVASGEGTSDSSSLEDNDAIGKLLSDFNYEEKCDKKVNSDLAKACDKIWKQKLSKEKIKDRLQKHHRLANCHQLIMNKVNPELFSSISKQGRSRDIKFQKLQNYNSKAAIPLIKQLNVMKNLKPREQLSEKTLKSIQTCASDSLGMLSCTNNSILQILRDTLAPELIPEYRQLKNEVQEGSKLLFGDDLKSRLSSKGHK